MHLMEGRLKPHGRKLITCMVVLIICLSILGLGCPGAAYAKSENSTPATNIVVNINDNGKIIPVHTYTIGEMQALSVSDAVYYSSIDAMPAPNATIAQGVLLSALVADINAKYNAKINISPSALKSIKLYATDNWFSDYTYDYLLGASRYYYPRLVETWDKDKNVVGPGAADNPVTVEPIIAVSSYQDRFLTDLNHAMLGPTDEGSTTFRFCFGQTAAELANNTVTNGRFGRWVNRMDIILPVDSTKTPQYEATPAEDAIYNIGTTPDGIKTMTVNAGQSGLKYFAVSVAPLLAHEGSETLVFTHLRNGTQLALNAIVADFDVVSKAKAGFNVQPGDIIKVYVVDQLSNDANINPVVYSN